VALLVAGLWLTRRAPRTNQARAGFALWGGWLVVTGAVFSFMQGIFHPYYAVALAPAVAALVGMGAAGLWEVRRSPLARWWLAGTVAVTAVWSYVLLRRTPDWHPGLAPLVLVGGLVVAGLVGSLPWREWHGAGLGRRAAMAVAVAGLLVVLAGPAAYSLDTAATPTAGPSPRPARTSPAPAPSAAPGACSAAPGRPASARARASGPGSGLGSAREGRAGAGAGWVACSTAAAPAPSWSRCSGRTPTATAGSRPRSGPTRPPGSSWPPATR
jgi:hypothetical protein